MIFPIFIGAAIVNRVLYRIQLVPMRDYTYFISQFSCCCYVLIYGAILVSRIRSGAVTPQMLEYAKENALVFACIGICLLYTSPSPRDVEESRMPSSA